MSFAVLQGVLLPFLGTTLGAALKKTTMLALAAFLTIWAAHWIVPALG